MGKDEKKPLGESIRENAAAFRKFLYNAEEKTVLGRNSSSWGRISVFYLFYYAFLAALFAISITVTLRLMPDDKPYYQTRLQTPGVTIQPKLPSSKASNTDIIYTTKGDDYKKYTDQLDTFLADYNKTEFGDCSNYTGAYQDGKPCVFVKINKIINWTPIPFNNLSDENDPKLKFVDRRDKYSKAPALSSWIEQQGLTYDKYRYVYVSCYGINSTKTSSDDPVDVGTFKLTGNDGILLRDFPYKGTAEKDTYKCPIVAIQFMSVKKNMDIKVGCKAYARNILDEERINAGFIHFTMKICDTDTCAKS